MSLRRRHAFPGVHGVSLPGVASWAGSRRGQVHARDHRRRRSTFRPAPPRRPARSKMAETEQATALGTEETDALTASAETDATAAAAEAEAAADAAALAEAEAVAAAAEAAEEAAAAAQAAAVADEAEKAEAAAAAAGRSGPYAAAAQSLRAEQTALASRSRAAVPIYADTSVPLYARQQQQRQQLPLPPQLAVPPQVQLQAQQQPQLQRSSSKVELVAARTYRVWAVVGVLMLGFVIWLLLWSTL